MNGRLGYTVTSPSFRIAVPGSPTGTPAPASADRITSRKVSSPSPITAMSKPANSDRVSSGSAVTWHPPMITRTSGNAALIPAASFPDAKIPTVVELMPTRRGRALAISRRHASTDRFSAAASITRTCAPSFSATAPRHTRAKVGCVLPAAEYFP